MARSRKDSQAVRELIQLMQKLPAKIQMGLVVVVLIGLGIFGISGCPRTERPPVTEGPAAPAGQYLFCTWNVENFYDDQDDPRENDSMENFFGTHPEMFNVKIQQLAEALLKMNNFIGPDIIALQEVESERALQALMERMNQILDKVGRPDRKFQNVLFIEDRTGRNFAPGIITRLPVVRDRTRQLGKGQMRRILEGHLVAGGHELVVITAHWTSRVTDKEENGTQRMRYAESCHGRYREIFTANPEADVILCGDFNDTFADASIQKGLLASDDLQTVIQNREVPRLFALAARLERNSDPKGTIYHNGKWSIFDHICLSRGLLDGKGWTCDTEQTQIFAPDEMRTGRAGEPFKFGDAKKVGQRGFSDHFPVTTVLRVESGNTAQ